MTFENQLENIRLELARSSSALNAARLLIEGGEYADAVSRSYYAMLHAARAVLLIESLEPRSHTGVGNQLNLRFVRTGRFPVDQARVLTRLQAEREAADYDRTAVFTEAVAREVMADAAGFREACLTTMRDAGFHPTA